MKNALNNLENGKSGITDAATRRGAGHPKLEVISETDILINKTDDSLRNMSISFYHNLHTKFCVLVISWSFFFFVFFFTLLMIYTNRMVGNIVKYVLKFMFLQIKSILE